MVKKPLESVGKELMKDVSLALSEAQAKKLVEGKSVQLKPEQIAKKGVRLALRGGKIGGMKSAKKVGKAYRLKLDPEELEINGEGLKSFLKGLWKGVKKVGRFILKTGVPQAVAKSALKVAAPAIVSAIPGAGPTASAVLTPVLQDNADAIVDGMSKLAGVGMRHGYGVPALTMVGGSMISRKGAFRGVEKKDNFSTLLASSDPSLHPPIDKVADFSMARFYPMSMAPPSLAGRQKTQKQISLVGEPTGTGFKPAGYGMRF